LRAVATSLVQSSYRVAVVSPDAIAWDELQTALSRSFQLRQIASWEQVTPSMMEFPMDGVIVDIDSQGRSAMEVLNSVAEFRRANTDLLIVTLTRRPDRDLRLKAAQIGSDRSKDRPTSIPKKLAGVTPMISSG